MFELNVLGSLPHNAPIGVYVCRDWLDYISSGAVFIIALINVGLTIYIFYKNKKDLFAIETFNRKFELTKALVIEDRIRILYNFFDEISKSCSALKNKNVTDKDKKAINERNLFCQAQFRLDFISVFQTVDNDIYRNLMDISDQMIDNLSNSIFDPGIRLSHDPMYKEKVLTPISQTRMKMLGVLLKLSEYK